MLIISYDISSNELRNNFSKFLSKFGYRIQYSVFKIKNSERIIENIKTKIDCYFSKEFKQSDSIIILNLSKTCESTTYGYIKNNETDLVIV